MCGEADERTPANLVGDLTGSSELQNTHRTADHEECSFKLSNGSEDYWELVFVFGICVTFCQRTCVCFIDVLRLCGLISYGGYGMILWVGGNWEQKAKPERSKSSGVWQEKKHM